MFDIVAPDNDKLALTVEVERVDDAEAELPCPGTRHAEPPSEREAENQQNEQRRNENGNRGGCVLHAIGSDEPVYPIRHDVLA